MSLRHSFSLRKIAALTIVLALAGFAASCTIEPFSPFVSFAGRPAVGYEAGSGQPLRVAVIDETGGTDWTPAINVAMQTYSAATPHLVFQTDTATANIVIRVRRYNDSQPPVIKGYLFQWGMGGFATVYDSDGNACNFPALPVDCNGEIDEAGIYLNDIIPAGPDIETRRERLVLHEMGHALGLERHSPDLDIAQLAERYGWN